MKIIFVIIIICTQIVTNEICNQAIKKQFEKNNSKSEIWADSVKLFMQKGIEKEKLCNTDDAEWNYSKAVNIDSANFDAVLLYGNFLNKARFTKYNSVINSYSKALKLAINDEQKSKVLSKLGTYLFANRNYEEAKNDYVKTIELYKKLPINRRELTVILSNLGCTYIETGNYEAAEASFTEAIDLCKLLPNDTLKSYNEIVTLRSNNSNSTVTMCGANNKVICNNELEYLAEGYTKYFQYSHHTTLVREARDNILLAIIYNNKAFLFETMKKNSEAIECFQHALAHFAMSENNIYDIIEINNSIINNLFTTKQYDLVEQYYNNKIALYNQFVVREPNYYKNIIAEYIELGGVQTELGRFDKAIETYTTALEISNKAVLANPMIYSKITKIYNQLANVYPQINQNNKADECYEKAIEMCNKLKDSPDYEYKTNLTAILYNKASFDYNIRNYEKAKDGYVKTITICNALVEEDSQYNSILANCFSKLGFIEQASNNYDVADTNFRKAISIYQQQDDSIRLALNYFNLAKLQIAKKEYTSASNTFKTSLDLYRIIIRNNSDYFDDYVYILSEAGSFMQNTGNNESAEAYYTEAVNALVPIQKEKPDYTEKLAKKYDKLAAVQFQSKEYDKSEASLNNAIKLFGQLSLKDTRYLLSEAGIYSELGWVMYRKANISSAIINVQEAIKIYQSYKDSASQISDVYSSTLDQMSYFQIFNKHFEEAEKFARLSISADTSTRVNNLANSLLLQGKYDEAIKYYAQLKNNENGKKRVFEDFVKIEKAGILNSDIKKIKEYLNQ